MKNKKRGILIACAIVVIFSVFAAVGYPLLTEGFGSVTAKKYYKQNLRNVNDIILVAECPEVDGKAQSIAGVKEAVRLGADAVEVDLCFRSDDTPVITNDYENNDDADTVGDLFFEMSDEKYRNVKIYFNIVQLSSLTKLNQLAVKYNMVSRIYLVGIDESHYGLVTSDDTIIPFLLKYDFSKEELKSIREGRFTAPECIAGYGAAGLEIDKKYATAEIMSTLNDFGIPFFVSGIDSTKDFCESLVNGAMTVLVDDIKERRKTLDCWTLIMTERISEERNKSLAEEMSKNSK